MIGIEYQNNFVEFKLESGVRQGGILSPLIYKVYVADLELWLQFASAIT